MPISNLFTFQSETSNGRSTLGLVFLSLAMFLFLATAVLGFLTVRRMKTSLGWVLHTYEVRSDIRTLRTAIMDVVARAEIAAALEDPVYLSGIPKDLATEKETVAQVRSLVSDNPEQEARLAELAPYLDVTRFLFENCSGPQCLPYSIQARQSALRNLWKSQEASLDILDRMETEEQRLLTARLAGWSFRFRVMIAALVTSFALAVLLMFLNFRLLIKEADRRMRSEMLIREHVDSYRALSSRILELQDIERRRIARELHDSVGQYLAGIKLQLSQIERQTAVDTPASKVLFSETTDLIDRSLTEIRTISHLLHPPLLDELGLYSAARWYVEGFAKRSGIQIDFSVDDFVDRLPKDTEVALFRVLQEALTNVHRHSGAKHVTVDVSCKNDVAVLVVKDDGKGIPAPILHRFNEGAAGGIGLAGMRERLAELRGTLTVESASSGTLVRARVPTDACKTKRIEPEGPFSPGF